LQPGVLQDAIELLQQLRRRDRNDILLYQVDVDQGGDGRSVGEQVADEDVGVEDGSESDS
jgi:hypothetical protein